MNWRPYNEAMRNIDAAVAHACAKPIPYEFGPQLFIDRLTAEARYRMLMDVVCAKCGRHFLSRDSFERHEPCESRP